MRQPSATAPPTWREVPLGDLLSLSNGLNAPKASYGAGIPFANVLEVITNESITEADAPGRIDIGPKALRRYEVRLGDVLFNRTSETQEELGLASVYVGTRPIVFGGFVFRGRPISDELTVAYSKYAFRSPRVRTQIVARGQGGIRANIGQRDLKSVRVLLPPPSEQLAIAEVLDDARALIAMLERMIAKKEAIRQGLMQQLLTGRSRLPGFTAPWREDTLGGVATVDPEALSSDTDPETLLDYISLEDADRGILRGWSQVTFGSAPSRARRVLRVGDLLFGTVRPNLQSHTLYLGGLRRPIASTGFAVVRANPNDSDPGFLFRLLMSDLTSRQIDRIIAGSNYPAVSSADVRNLRFRLPRLDEQQAIGAILADCDAELSALRALLTKASHVKQGMMQDLLAGRVRLGADRKAE